MQTEIGQRKKREKRMIAYKCAKCGAGELEPLGDGKKAVCQYCFSVMVLPTLDPEAFNRATELRQQLQFDQAEMAFERIVSEYPDDSESYWNLVLCRYGIEYVKDRDGSLVPTCHRMSYQSILEDPDYQKALQYADGYSRQRYEEEGAKIDRVLKRIAQISHSQPDYDIFISYKETDEAGYRTADSAVAQNIYDALKHKYPDLNIFLSRVTLKELAAGMEYEPVIFSALNTAKLMLVVGTSRENLESVWVRNEWSRYRRMMERDNSKKMAVVFKNMDPGRDFPPELGSFSIQAMEAEGFYMQDLIRGVENLLGLKEKQQAVSAAAAGNQIYESANSLQAANLLRRARQELDAGDTDAANSYLKKALDMQPDYAEAWWELVQIGTKQMTKLSEDEPFALDKDTQRAWNMVRSYASGAQLASYEAQMRDYEQRWTAGVNHKKAEQLFQEIREKTGEGKLFDRYTQYCLQSVKVEQCLALADEGQKKTIQAYMQSYEENHAKFRELQEWKRSRPIDQIQQDQEYQRIAREQQKYKKKVEAGARQQNGVLFGDVLLAVAALVVAYLGSGYSGLWQGNERMLLPVVPFVFGTVLCLFLMRLLVYRNCESEHQNYGEFLVCILISAAFSILPYLGYQYWLYQKIQPQGLEWTCIFSGLSVFAMVAAVILALLFVCVGQLIAGCVIVAIGAIAYQAIDGIEGMSFEEMARAVPELNEKLLFAAAVLVVLFFILYVRNKVAMQNYQKSTAPYERLEQEREHYMEDQLKPVLDYFRPYMDEKYLKELQIEDTEG